MRYSPRSFVTALPQPAVRMLRPVGWAPTWMPGAGLPVGPKVTTPEIVPPGRRRRVAAGAAGVAGVGGAWGWGGRGDGDVGEGGGGGVAGLRVVGDGL